MDLGREPKHPHDLGHSRPGDALPPGYLGLGGDLAGLEEGLPLDGLAEKLDDPGRPGVSRWLGLAPAGGGRGHHPVGGHPARQGADVAAFERPLRAQRDLDRLFAIGGPGYAVGVVLGDMDDPEPDLGLGPTRTGSNTVTLAEPITRPRNIRVFQLTENPESESPWGFFVIGPRQGDWGCCLAGPDSLVWERLSGSRP